MRGKIAELIWKHEDVLSDGFQYYAVDAKEMVERLADAILSLPSGLIAGEHEITIGEALDDYQRIILDCPAYPCVGYFNGDRITKPIPPSGDERK